MNDVVGRLGGRHYGLPRWVTFGVGSVGDAMVASLGGIKDRLSGRR